MSSSSKTNSKPKASTKTKKSATKSTSSKTKESTSKKKSTTKKATTGKTRTVTKSVKEKPVKSITQDNNSVIVEKTLISIERLGDQTFALSPFSQYYDDWLVNLRRTVAEFEADSNVKNDEDFTKQNEQALSDIQATLTKLRTQEATFAEDEKTLFKTKQDLKGLDADYIKKKHELNNKHDIDTEHLTTQIKTLENDIENQVKIKFSFFQFSAKKTAANKLEQTKQSLKETRNQLETALQNFTVEQNKLQDNYTSKKQELTSKADALRNSTEQLEIDTSKEARKEICARLNSIIKEQILTI